VKDNNILKVGTNEMELVDFRILKEEHGRIYEGIYGVNVAKVREIIRKPRLTELPGVPEFIEGIFDLRGVVIPVVNLAKWMGITPPADAEKNARVIIAEFNNVLIGFVVHDAKRIRRISWKEIEPASFASGEGALDKSKITGVTRIENDAVLLILDLENVVEELGLYTPDSSSTDVHKNEFTGIVLLLDDSSTARKIVKEALIEMGFKVVEAMDGEEGLSKLNDIYDMYHDEISKHLKLIVSDVEMPRMDGYTLASEIKKYNKYKNLPLIAVTSRTSKTDRMRGVESGMVEYITKPYSQDYLMSVVQKNIKFKAELA